MSYQKKLLKMPILDMCPELSVATKTHHWTMTLTEPKMFTLEGLLLLSEVHSWLVLALSQRHSLRPRSETLGGQYQSGVHRKHLGLPLGIRPRSHSRRPGAFQEDTQRREAAVLSLRYGQLRRVSGLLHPCCIFRQRSRTHR